jgi:Protein of unknown function (DUF2630)
MKDEADDQSVLKVIQRLTAEEHRLFEHEARTDADRARLAKINIELDQCWDLLRQRQDVIQMRRMCGRRRLLRTTSSDRERSGAISCEPARSG